MKDLNPKAVPYTVYVTCTSCNNKVKADDCYDNEGQPLCRACYSRPTSYSLGHLLRQTPGSDPPGSWSFDSWTIKCPAAYFNADTFGLVTITYKGDEEEYPYEVVTPRTMHDSFKSVTEAYLFIQRVFDDSKTCDTCK